MTYCRLENNKVVEVFNYNPFEWIPNKAFTANCLECPNHVKQGYLYRNGEFVNIDEVPKEPTAEERLSAIEDVLLMML